MKKLNLLLLSILLVNQAEAIEIKPSTNFFILKDFYTINQKGGYEEYKANGFYDTVTSSQAPQVYVLPRISFESDAIRTSDSQGREIYNPINDIDNIETLKIKLSYNSGLPNNMQKFGLGATVYNSSAQSYLGKPLKLANGNPIEPTNPSYLNAVNFAIGFDSIGVIRDDKSHVDNLLQKQAELEGKWNNIKPQSVNIDNLELTIIVDAEPVATRRISNTFIPASGTLPELVVKNMTPKIYRKILNNDYEIMIGFDFKDARVSTIDASISLSTVMDNYINETQVALSQSKNKGWGIFNFGSRKSALSQNVKTDVNQKTSTTTTANTVIVMNDADEGMIKLFENDFFPSIDSKQSVIDYHLKGYEVAKSDGNENLANAHLKYIEMLKSSDPKVETDAAAAAAALSKKDYATFVAKGMRFTQDKTNAKTSYHRILSSSVEEGVNKTWEQIKKVSVNRSVNITILPEKKEKYAPYLGLCGHRIIQMNIPAINPYPPFNPTPYPPSVHPAMLVTCVFENGPMARSGILPGTIITEIGGFKPTMGVFDKVADNFEAGDNIRVKKANPHPVMFGQWQEEAIIVKSDSSTVKKR